ncbi:hypothetical protein KDA_10660 [Dictyobacter alpinus]|uniref:Uncharacterized protein n=1 Tax=Dictyobacter alpinus TaxID=2014873 RepID=A0A402B2K1_9CHLR|nr:hypothetical protein [Dictyobacter alpinus]GCE25582.1 hypothetical protein KDA_10660 [Dictyobacter alpinus]
MRHEKINDIITLVIESTDERTSVMNWLYYHLGQRYQQPVVVVLPPDAVFRRPGDLRELQQATAQHNARLVLVIEGNERLRLWARRHGFTVYSMVETCHKALHQQGNPPSWPSFSDGPQPQSDLRTVIEQSPVTSFTGPWNSYEQTDDGTKGETYHSAMAEVAVANLRRPSGQFSPVGRPEYRSSQTMLAERPFTPRVTEPLDRLPAYGSIRGGQRIREVRARTTVALVEKEHEAPFLPVAEFSLHIPVPAEETGKVAAISTPGAPSPLRTHFQQLQQDKLLLFLVALVILGILGGVGFSYLLQVVHSTQSHQVPVSLLQTVWGI